MQETEDHNAVPTGSLGYAYRVCANRHYPDLHEDSVLGNLARDLPRKPKDEDRAAKRKGEERRRVSKPVKREEPTLPAESSSQLKKREVPSFLAPKSSKLLPLPDIRSNSPIKDKVLTDIK
jgi:hypothetical protein